LNHGLKYVLDCLRRSADNSACWPVYPAEAGAILSEFDRLQKENEELRGERAAVVAWLREEAEAAAQTYTTQAGEWAKRIDDMADAIERGDHLTGVKP